jgi:lipoate-protein ligase A
MRWALLLDATPRPGWQNMAIDQTLLGLAAGQGLAVLRLYRWEPWCLSFGRHEPAAARYGRARVESLGIDVVRRPTGGRAVWHARELTYALAAPAALGSLSEVYHRAHAMLCEAIGRLGGAAKLAPAPARHPAPDAGACFAAPAGGEVLIECRKVVGSAQVREGGGILQHGAVLLEDDQRLVHQLAGRVPDALPEITLSDALGWKVPWEEMAEAVVSASAAWAAQWDRLDPARIAADAERHAARFRDPAWTWKA